MIEFPRYAKIKDNYCICYFGYSDEYLTQLSLLKPIIEQHFQGLKIFFGCRDDRFHLLDNCPQNLKLSELRTRRGDFAHIREIRFNGVSHPVEDLLNEAGIKNITVKKTPEEIYANKAVIITSGNYPTKPLEKRYIEIIKKSLTDEKFEIEIDTDVSNAGMVVGVESVALYSAAGKGIRTKIIPTGIGINLFQRMFPFGQIMKI